MCGIAGLIDPSGAPVDRALLARMTDRLAPRGPDAQGAWFGDGVGLGHRRLKVIDLSDAGAQPMGGEGGHVQVVYNGEIYNFVELRAELEARGHRFRSRTDTEVLVHGYEAWGDGVIDRIEGMFAFGLWDGRRRRFLGARDRMGKKPFYWARIPRDGGRPPLFAFASELKALLVIPDIDRSVDPDALRRYLTFEYVPPPFTIVRGARKLDAAQRLVLEAARDPFAPPAIDRYWDLPFPERHRAMRPEEAAEQLRAILRRAVERRLVADVPLGVFLSGGIDSSTVVALMSAGGARGRVKTFSIGFPDQSYDETRHARLVSQTFGTEHHEEQLTPASLVDVLPEVSAFLDEPLGDASILPTYLLSKFTRRHVTVALGGDGSDELFAGYPTFAADRLAGAVYDRTPSGVRALARGLAGLLPTGTGYFSLDFKVNQFLRGAEASGPRRHQSWLASFLPSEQERLLAGGMHDGRMHDGGIHESPADRGAGPLDDVDARARATRARDPADLAMDFYCRFYLPGDINVKVDRASSAVGLEVRAPFLDTEVVTFACSLPPDLRLHRLTGKYVLRQAMAGILPPAILRRPKQGFAMPVAPWIRGALQPMLRDELAPARLRREGHFDPDEVTRILDAHVAGTRDGRKQLWTLFMFERWLSNHGGTPSVAGPSSPVAAPPSPVAAPPSPRSEPVLP